MEGASDAAIELNEIQLLEEAQNMVKSIGVGGRNNVKDDGKSNKSDKKSALIQLEIEGKKMQPTEDDGKELRGSKTKITEGSDEAVCRICLLSESEEPDKGPASGDPNPMISPCKCAGTMGIIHFKCLRVWLETKRTKKVHKGQTTIKFNKMDCELCKT